MTLTYIWTAIFTILSSQAVITWAIWPLWRVNSPHTVTSPPSSALYKNNWQRLFERQVRKYRPTAPSDRMPCHVTSVTSPEEAVSQLSAIVRNLKTQGIHRDTIAEILASTLDETPISLYNQACRISLLLYTTIN